MLTATAAATTLVGVLPAAAAVPTSARVSLSEAVLTLPAPGELPPGNVTHVTQTKVPKPTALNPCNLAEPNSVALHDNGAAIGMYATDPATPVAELAQWVVSTRVFSSAKAAHVGVSRLGVTLNSCPTRATVGGVTYKRTWSAHYVTQGGWHGYHTVDVISVKGDKTQLRHIAVYLQRGNVLIQVDEIATVVGHNSPTQEARRLAVQKTLAARVSEAAVS